MSTTVYDVQSQTYPSALKQVRCTFLFLSDIAQIDRFIPNRSAMNMEVCHYNLGQEVASNDFYDSEADSSVNYKSSVAKSLFGETVEEHKILALKTKAPAPHPGYQNHLRVLYSQNTTRSKPTRVIAQKEERTLDAPGLVDDYYLNLVDWSASNILAVALGPALYLWNAHSGTPELLLELPEEDGQIVTSVNWSPANPNYLAVGTSDHMVNLWDVSRGVQVRKLEGHAGRVGSLAWNGSTLSSGSFDSNIINWDVRSRNPRVSTFSGHNGEVCGLKWSLDGKQLASGGNDNLLNIWKLEDNAPQFTFEDHQAAVKALAWCPWQPNLLASGGGTADRTIKFWNTQTGTLLNSVDTESQVCSILWSAQRKELVSSHGFSKNQLIVWKYPSMTKVTELTGHTSRVLHLAQSPDGTSVMSASADESLKFWRIFDSDEDSGKRTASSGSLKQVSARGIRSSLNKIR